MHWWNWKFFVIQYGEEMRHILYSLSSSFHLWNWRWSFVWKCILYCGFVEWVVFWYENHYIIIRKNDCLILHQGNKSQTLAKHPSRISHFILEAFNLFNLNVNENDFKRKLLWGVLGIAWRPHCRTRIL